VAASMAAAGVTSIVGARVPPTNHPPEPFDDAVTLPGEQPANIKSIKGGWQYEYWVPEVPMESGEQADLRIFTVLVLHENGTYQLSYNAVWNRPDPFMGDMVMKVDVNGIKALHVNELGKFSLSGEVLLLEPRKILYSEGAGLHMKQVKYLPNVNHSLIVRQDDQSLSVAGRCTSYQIDPVCKDTPIIWYSLKPQR
jgi:hypothetical protein